ncbi:MAG: hypothetical protein ACRD6B_12120 [Bryobacteraceae bacterium]
MRNHWQIQVGKRIEKVLRLCFAQRQLRTQEEAVLRTGGITTKGHPLQVHAGARCAFAGFLPFPCTAVHQAVHGISGRFGASDA